MQIAFTVDPTVQEALTTGTTDVGNALVSQMGTMLPIALTVVGTVIAIMFGLRFFLGLIKRH